MDIVAAPKPSPPWLRTPLAFGIVIAAVVAAYMGSLHGPFVFDDRHSIVENPSIRTLAFPDVLTPPPGRTVTGRPVLNVSFALHHALGGLEVRGYHIANLAIHAAAACVLFALLRRTLLQPRLHTRFAAVATPLALAATLLWALHPLQTQAVTYLVQRAESLMALFYLLTLYGFARSIDAPRRLAWQAGCVAACALGMATKETMVSAPLAVWLYDRTFIAAAAGERRQCRPLLYSSLAATWIVLVALVVQNSDRGGTAGFATGVSPWHYALTQAYSVTHYLRLAAWPHPLVFDYGEYEKPDALALLPSALLVVALLAGVIALWRRRPAAGFAATVFLLVLAPTTSVFPILTEPLAEHRMYLPLASVAALAAAALHAVTGRHAVALLLGLALSGALTTARRNRDYRDERTLWETTVATVPRNARAHSSLGVVLAAQREWSRAEAHFNTAIALRPDFVAARAELGALLADQGRLAEAEAQYLAILRLHPTSFVTLNTLGTIHFGQGRLNDAVRDFEQALQTQPDSAPAHNNLGGVLVELGDLARAKTYLETALRLAPDYAEAHYNLGNVLARQNRLTEARGCYERALRLQPAYAAAHAHLGVVLQNLGERAAAVRHYREALRLQPDFGFVRDNLAALGEMARP